MLRLHLTLASSCTHISARLWTRSARYSSEKRPQNHEQTQLCPNVILYSDESLATPVNICEPLFIPVGDHDL